MVTDMVARAMDVCGWCADQCIQEADPMMAECIRLCEDMTELGEAVLALLPRNSRYSTDLLQVYQQAIQACARECSQHPHAHCQECAATLGRASQTVQQYMGMLTQGGTGQPSGVQQPAAGTGQMTGGMQQPAGGTQQSGGM